MIYNNYLLSVVLFYKLWSSLYYLQYFILLCWLLLYCSVGYLYWTCFLREWYAYSLNDNKIWFFSSRLREERPVITLTDTRTRHIKNKRIVCRTRNILHDLFPHLFLIHSFSTLFFALFIIASLNSLSAYTLLFISLLS